MKFFYFAEKVAISKLFEISNFDYRVQQIPLFDKVIAHKKHYCV